MEFSVEFDTGFKLNFLTYNNSISKKWEKALKTQLLWNENLFEKDRFYNINSLWSTEYTIKRLNKCIDAINEWREIIPPELRGSLLDQEVLNKLHKYFEEMRGGILSPGKFWKEAPQNIKIHIRDYNVLIHRLETITKKIVITFEDNLRYPLENKDFDYFSKEVKFGQVSILYCEIGKSLWNVFWDNDSFVGENNIRPLKYYSADMIINFSNFNLPMKKFNSWWDENENYLNSLGFYKGDKKLAIGYIHVASLISWSDEEYYLNELSKCSEIRDLQIV